jgi:hypothetical protein
MTSAQTISKTRNASRAGFFLPARGKGAAQAALEIFGDVDAVFNDRKLKSPAASGQVWRLAATCGLLSVNCGHLRSCPQSGILMA